MPMIVTLMLLQLIPSEIFKTIRFPCPFVSVINTKAIMEELIIIKAMKNRVLS